MSGPCTDCGGPDYQTLEARIVKLEAENKKAVYGCCEECRALSEAEAEMEKWKQEALDGQEEVHRIRMCYPGGEGEELLSEAEATIAELQAENRATKDYGQRAFEAQRKQFERAEQAEAERDALQKMAGCPHYSSSGVDQTPSDNPMKVWRCDECGFEYTEIWEPELGLRSKEARWQSRGGKG